MALDFESCAGQAFVAGVRDAERALLSAKDILLKQKQVVAVAQIQQAQGTCCYVRAAFLFDTTSAAIWYDEANRHFLAAFGVLNQELEDKYKNYEHPCASFAEQVKKLDKEDKNMFLHETIIRSVMPCTRALRLALADCAIDLGISFGNRRRTIDFSERMRLEALRWYQKAYTIRRLTLGGSHPLAQRALFGVNAHALS